MLDFLMISVRPTKKGVAEIYPKFVIKKSSDLMIRGGDFYAIWVEERGLWSTDEQDALQLIDKELDEYASENKAKFDGNVKVLHMWDSENGMIDHWHRYCQKHMRDSFHMLDETLIFSNMDTDKKNYASKRLEYPLEACPIPSYERLISTLYSPEERRKIEWAIGSIVSGDSKKIQKFLVLYGAAGTGKSTILNIIQMLFEGYYSVFDAKALGSSSNSFALEAFKSNPLVAIQHDGDLSRIEDNTRLNSLVSHELMTVNEKFKSAYSNRFKSFLFMGTNRPVRITDAKSGLIRRLIDVSPTGDKVPEKEYKNLFGSLGFELGGIACHCRDVYLSDPGYYDSYIPTSMMGASNDFYNFVEDHYFQFKDLEDGITLKQAYELYSTYADSTNMSYKVNQRVFKEEFKNYFEEFHDRYQVNETLRVRSYFRGFKSYLLDGEQKKKEPEKQKESWIVLEEQESNLDIFCSDCPAQYATDKETPSMKWENVSTCLGDLDTHKIHYIRPGENHIVIDFDLKDADGNKDLQLNIEAASKWPPTYAEVSKGGSGLHLHYIYTGESSELASLYSENIEVKVFSGNSALRRRLSKCNNLPIAKISSGLPLKGEKVVDFESVKNEKAIRTMLARNLRKQYHAGTKPSVDFIYKILDDAYKSGMHYDVRDMRNDILAFAVQSSHHAEYCMSLVSKMQFCSDDISENISNDNAPIVFYDVEVFPNLFLINYKKKGPLEENPVVRMINPTPSDVEDLLKFRLIGFNCRRYDNHILYGRLMGYDNMALYKLSQKLVGSKKGEKDNGTFGEAYNISYTDIYDFASAGNKKSLKKLEIEMGIHHQELGLPWDQPVPEDKWLLVAEYCDNDVIATEAAFEYLNADWTARQILADLAGLSVNDTTNSLTTRIIFGSNKHPQDQFCYRDLSQPVHDLTEAQYEFLSNACPEMMSVTHGEDGSLLPYFPGYSFDRGKSTYRGEVTGEGGFVYAEPDIHYNVALLDIASMHPHSAIAEILFGVIFTTAFRDIVEGRVSIKHEDWETVNGMLGGKLTPYVQKVINGEMSSKQLADALKTAINSVYGLTSAKFDNPFRDPRNIDNIVAKRGALFMVDLKNAVQEKGFRVAHIKTDSIKIPDATPEIIDFVMNFGLKYGYTFEHEATYEKMCLVNDSTYIAKYSNDPVNGKHAGEWTATGAQFQVPYVFKRLFSKEKIEFEDKCETKSVDKGHLTIDLNQGLGEDEHNYIFVGRVGSFCPIQEGKGGGILYRESDGSYYAATGTKGYRWLESEIVKTNGLEDAIDISYYETLCDKAKETISQYGDFESFAD